MSVRRIKPYKSNNSGFIQKVIEIGRKIPKMYSTEDLEKHESDFTKEEYLALYQSFFEKEVWDNSSWGEKQVLAPLVDFFYDDNNCPVLVFPRFKPLATEQEAFSIEDDDCFGELYGSLVLNGVEDEDIGSFIENIIQVCEEYDLNEEDILYNLSNLGWNATFGARIVDFGLNNEIMRWYNKE